MKPNKFYTMYSDGNGSKIAVKVEGTILKERNLCIYKSNTSGKWVTIDRKTGISLCEQNSKSKAIENLDDSEKLRDLFKKLNQESYNNYIDSYISEKSKARNKNKGFEELEDSDADLPF